MGDATIQVCLTGCRIAGASHELPDPRRVSGADLSFMRLEVLHCHVVSLGGQKRTTQVPGCLIDTELSLEFQCRDRLVSVSGGIERIGQTTICIFR